MSDPAILFVKPKAISAKDKKALATAGVIVVEVENPQDVKFTRASSELGGGPMLSAAVDAIRNAGFDSVKTAFANNIATFILEPGKPEETSDVSQE